MSKRRLLVPALLILWHLAASYGAKKFAPSRKKIVIDTDGIHDDMEAISLALQHPRLELLAITTVTGCVPVRQATANVARCLRANNKKVPIYQGADRPLMAAYSYNPMFNVTKIIASLFGADGIGDKPKQEPKALPEDANSAEPNKTAALALIDIFKQYDDVILISIGPMTNIALALKLDPSFAHRPKQFIFMGGIGNTVPDSTAEWNFWSDPEATHIVLAAMRSAMVGVTWESVIGAPKHSHFLAHWSLKGNGLSEFLAATVINNTNFYAILYCGQITIAAVIDPKILTKKSLLYASVELHGTFTRGQMTNGWMTEHAPWNRVELVEEYNVTAVSRLLLDAVKYHK